MTHIFRPLSLGLLCLLAVHTPRTLQAGSKCPTMGPRLTVQQYCERYAQMAREQMIRHGVPASITLAQGILESGSGSSYLAVVANNHFGIKAYSRNWTGPVERCDDDARNEPFCKFGSVAEGYEYHSTFLIDNPRYARLFTLPLTDYAGWAQGLKDCGYATNPQYGTLLINLIEKNHLYDYDNLSYSTLEIVNPEGLHQVFYTQSGRKALRYIICKDGDDLSLLSREFGINKKKLIRNNDLAPEHYLKSGDIIYLQNKRSKAMPEYTQHVVLPGQSLWMISQMYGVTVRSLMRRNHLDSAIVHAGQVLLLR